MLDLKRSVVLYSMRLNHVGLAGFCGHLQAALSAAAGWHFKQARLLRRSWHALGTDLLHLMPVENRSKLRLSRTQEKLKPANVPS